MTRADWSHLAKPTAIVLASRLVSIGLLWVGSTRLVSDPSAGLPIHPPLDIWDGPWYLSIAVNGYHALPLAAGPGGGFYDIAFFPLWPALIRILSLGGALPMGVVAVITANLLFLAGALAVHAWCERTWSRQIADRALLLLCFGPAAYVGSLDYSEPLFLVVAAGFFLVAARPVLRTVLALSAGLTRITGLAIGAAAGARFIGSHGRDRGALASALTSVLAFALWWMCTAFILGDPAAWLRGSPAWFMAGGVGGGPGSLLDLGAEAPLWWLLGGAVAAWLAILAVGAGLLMRARNLEPAVYAALVIATAIAFGAWSSWPRLALVAFPAYGALAAHSSPRAWLWLLAGAFALELVLAPLAGAGVLVP